MELHIRFDHQTEKEMFTCKECGKVFIKPKQLLSASGCFRFVNFYLHSQVVKNLKSHMKLHSDEKPHECQVCNKVHLLRRNFMS